MDCEKNKGGKNRCVDVDKVMQIRIILIIPHVPANINVVRRTWLPTGPFINKIVSSMRQ